MFLRAVLWSDCVRKTYIEGEMLDSGSLDNVDKR